MEGFWCTLVQQQLHATTDSVDDHGSPVPRGSCKKGSLRKNRCSSTAALSQLGRQTCLSIRIVSICSQEGLGREAWGVRL
jgi:hypothetical protein